MRFLGAWTGSVLAAALIAALVLGRDETPRAIDLTAIDGTFDERYALAYAALQDGAVLYLRGESRTGPDDSGGFATVRITETWVGTTADGVPVARSEEADADGVVFRITEIEGGIRTLVVDVAAGTEDREPTAVEPVQPPTELLTTLRRRTAGRGTAAATTVDVPPIGTYQAARIAAGPPPENTEVVFAIDDPLIHIERSFAGVGGESTLPRSELALLAWAVLPAGTPLGARP